MNEIKIITSDLVGLDSLLNRIGAENIISVTYKESIGIRPFFLVIYKEIV